MEHLFHLSAFAHEAREFAVNSLRASKHFARLLFLSAKEAKKWSSWIARLLFERPALFEKLSPHKSKKIEGPPPNHGPFPFSHPPSRFF